MVIYQTNFGAEIFRISMHGDATPPPPRSLDILKQHNWKKNKHQQIPKKNQENKSLKKR